MTDQKQSDIIPNEKQRRLRDSQASFFRTAASQSVEVFVGQSGLFKEVSAAKGADDRETAGNRGGMECDAMGH